MFTQSRKLMPASVHFTAGKDWEEHTIPLSAFGTDGHDITAVFIGGDRMGQYQLELSRFRFGTGASIGVELIPLPSIPGSKGKFSTARLIVGNVAKGSPADGAGLKPGDTIISVRNEKVDDPDRMKALLWQSEPGSTVPIEIVRDGKRQILSVRLGEYPRRSARASIRSVPSSGAGADRRDATSCRRRA